jgi:hypothetical protein
MSSRCLAPSHIDRSVSHEGCLSRNLQVLARSSPKDKYILVQTLKKLGEVRHGPHSGLPGLTSILPAQACAVPLAYPLGRPCSACTKTLLPCRWWL